MAAEQFELTDEIDCSDLFEIRPEKPYSEADLKWTNPLARCNREKLGKKEVPVAGKVQGWEEYDTVYLGLPGIPSPFMKEIFLL